MQWRETYERKYTSVLYRVSTEATSFTGKTTTKQNNHIFLKGNPFDKMGNIINNFGDLLKCPVSDDFNLISFQTLPQR